MLHRGEFILSRAKNLTKHSFETFHPSGIQGESIDFVNSLIL